MHYIWQVKKVLIITYYWPPAGGPGVQRWLKMVKYLPEAGVEPVVLTVEESYAAYPVMDPSFLAEVAGSIKVVRTKSFEPLRIYGKIFGQKKVPYSGFSNVDTETVGSKLSRWVRGNLFIPDARKGWNRFALPEARKILKREEINAVVTTGPPHSTHLIGLALKSEFPALTWIADFRDPWTDIYYYDALLHTPKSRERDASLELQVLESADQVLAVCPSNVDLLAAKLPPERREKIKLVTNGYDEEDFQGIERATRKGKLEIGYTGTLAPMYDVYPILQILATLDIPWQLTIAGSITPEINKMAEELKIDKHISFLGHVSHRESLELLRRSNVLLHIMPNTPKSMMGTTGKLYEYIGSGTPIINFGPVEGDSAMFIESANAGSTFNRNEGVKAGSFLSDIYSGYKNSRMVDVSRFDRRVIAGQFAEGLKKM
jgi:glycosyltransferase involved in cell wall biosynthesis